MNPETQVTGAEALWMIEASAGTGKTYRLVSEVLLAVLRGVELRKVLVVTFTNKATAELAKRLQSKLMELQAALELPAADATAVPTAPDEPATTRDVAFARAIDVPDLKFDEANVSAWRERVARAIGSLELASVMTIHSFCQRMLTRFGAELGRPETLQMLPDAAAVRREIVENAFGGWLYAEANWDDGDLGRATGDFLTGIAGLDPGHAEELLEKSVAYPNALVVSDWVHSDSSPVALELSPEDALFAFREAVNEGGRLIAERRNVAASVQSLLKEIEARDAVKAGTSMTVPGLSPNARYLRVLLSQSKSQKADREPDLSTLPRGKTGLTGLWATLKEVSGVWTTSDKLLSFPRGEISIPAPKANHEKTAPEFAQAFASIRDAAAAPQVDLWLSQLLDATELARLVNHARTCWLRASGALWRARLQQEGWLTYDAMLSELATALHDPELGERLRVAIRTEFQSCFVDEFQDTDDVQWSALRRLFAEPPAGEGAVPMEPGRHFVLVGDPKQSIYRFRGSDLAVYREARGIAVRNETLFSLTQSYRSSEPLVHALNVLFKKHDIGPDLPVWPFLTTEIEAEEIESRAKRQEPDAAVEFVVVPSENRNATAARVAARIAADRTKKPTQDQAVLVRSHYDGALIEQELSDLRIRSRRRELPLMMTEEASTVLTWLNFLAKPEVERFRRALALTPWLGWEVAALALVVREGGAAWAGWLEQLDESRRVFQRDGVLAGFERLMQLRSAWDYIAVGWHGEVQSDRLRQVLNALEARAGEFGTNPAELARWMADERRKEDDSEFKVRAAAKERHDTAVDIWTVHAAKGLEASVVYLPFLGRSSDPDATLCKNTFIFGFAEDGSEHRWIDTRLFLKGKALEDGAAEEATIQTDDKGVNLFAKRRALREVEMEQARLGYVAMTRARHRVVVWWLEDDVGVNGILAGVLIRQSPAQLLKQRALVAKLKSAKKRVAEVEKSLAKTAPKLTQADLEQAQQEVIAASMNPDRVTNTFWVGDESFAYVSAETPQAVGAPKLIQPAEFVLRAWAKLAEDGSDKLQGRIEVRRDDTPWFEAAEEMRAAYEASLVKDDGAEAALLAERGALEIVWAEAAKRSHQYASAKRSFTSMSQQLKNKEAAKSRADVGEEEVQRTDGEEDTGIILRDERWDRLGGTPFGNLVHSFYEELDFETRRSVDEELDAKELLRRHASINTRSRLSTFDAEGGWGDALLKDLLDVLEVPLAGGDAGAGCSLSEVTLDTRADESSFDMRMCDSRKAAEALLEGYEGPPSWKSYFKALAAGIRNETGILTGKMDLVFARPGADGRQRWFIADYKTNRLDPLKPADDAFARYEADRLFEAMAHSHYLLQLLIYTVAWHRHLQQTLGDGYDYDRDFGGVYYLYVRGMMQGSDRGQFFIKPPRAWVETLSTAWGKRPSNAKGEAAE